MKSSKFIGLFLFVLTAIISLNAVSLQDALMNYLQGKSNREFWREQSFGAVVMPGITAAFLSLTPGGLLAYPPFVIGQFIGMSIAGGAGMVYNRPESMRGIFGKRSSGSLDLLSSQENNPLVNENVTQQEQPAVVATSGENIFAALIMAAITGAGYKLYQWYNAPKKDKPIEQSINSSQSALHSSP